jgi:hypothetical protein
VIHMKTRTEAERLETARATQRRSVDQMALGARLWAAAGSPLGECDRYVDAAHYLMPLGPGRPCPKLDVPVNGPVFALVNAIRRAAS